MNEDDIIEKRNAAAAGFFNTTRAQPRQRFIFGDLPTSGNSTVFREPKLADKVIQTDESAGLNQSTGIEIVDVMEVHFNNLA